MEEYVRPRLEVNFARLRLMMGMESCKHVGCIFLLDHHIEPRVLAAWSERFGYEAHGFFG